MEYQFLHPNSALRLYINGYHYINDKDFLHRKKITSLPSGNTTMLIFLGRNSIEIIHQNINQSKLDYSIISGIIEGPCNIFVECPFNCLLIDFNPIGFFNLFNIPGEDIFNQIHNVVDILGSEIKYVIQKLHIQNCVYKQKNILDKFFIQKLDCKNNNNSLSSTLISLFYSPVRTQKLADICCSCNLSLRYFEKKFKEQVGITPVKYKRIVRANMAFRFMILGERYFEIINKLDFYDQSHFIKEFKWLTGFTPQNYKNEIAKSVNMGASHFIISKGKCSVLNN